MYYREKIDNFLKEHLKLCLHPEKSKIIKLGNGYSFLGFRVFFYHKLLKKSNLRKMRNTFQILTTNYRDKEADYDKVYDFMEGWIAYVKNANTHNLRKKILAVFEKEFPTEISTKEINRYLRIHRKR